MYVRTCERDLLPNVYNFSRAVLMSIRRYFKPLNGLPHPRGSLSASIPSTAIAIANSEVEKVTGESVKQKNKSSVVTFN